MQLKYIPEITVAQHEKISLQLPFFDVDNDYVSCRWASNYDEGGGIYAARFGILLQVSLGGDVVTEHSCS